MVWVSIKNCNKKDFP